MRETQHYHEEQWADQVVILKWREGVSPPAPQKMTRLAPGPRRQQRFCTKRTSGLVNSGRDALRGTLHTGLRNQMRHRQPPEMQKQRRGRDTQQEEEEGRWL